MEIKTTKEIRISSSVKIQEAKFQKTVDDIDNQRWVAIDDILDCIHKIREMKMDAEDLFDALSKTKHNSSFIQDCYNYKCPTYIHNKSKWKCVDDCKDRISSSK